MAFEDFLSTFTSKFSIIGSSRSNTARSPSSSNVYQTQSWIFCLSVPMVRFFPCSTCHRCLEHSWKPSFSYSVSIHFHWYPYRGMWPCRLAPSSPTPELQAGRFQSIDRSPGQTPISCGIYPDFLVFFYFIYHSLIYNIFKIGSKPRFFKLIVF